MIQFLFKIYRIFFTVNRGACRFNPTCSEYFEEALQKHGFLKGSYVGVLRILSCHPLSKRATFDPLT